MNGYQDIDPEQLQQLQRQGAIDLIDVRSEAELARGIIAGARHLPLHMLPLKAHEFKPGKPIVLYCQTGVRSAHAGAFLAQQGLTDVYNLRGGIVAWAREGYPVSTFSPAL